MADVRVFDDGAEEKIRRLAVFLSDLRSFWPLLVPVATGWWRKQFESEGEFGGAKWAPLSPGYAAYKDRVRPGKGILVFSGDLKRAASSPSRVVTPISLTLTIDSDYLQYHQQEDEAVPNLPARPLVFGSPLPAEAQAELDAVAEVYVRDLLGRI